MEHQRARCKARQVGTSAKCKEASEGRLRYFSELEGHTHGAWQVPQPIQAPYEGGTAIAEHATFAPDGWRRRARGRACASGTAVTAGGRPGRASNAWATSRCTSGPRLSRGASVARRGGRSAGGRAGWRDAAPSVSEEFLTPIVNVAVGDAPAANVPNSSSLPPM